MPFVLMVLSLAWLVLPLWALVAALRAERELRALRERVQRLEAARGGLSAVPPADAPLPVVPPPLPFTTPAPAHEWSSASRAPEPAGSPASVPGTAAAPAPAARFFDSARFEELVGGLWLQNVGAVLLLVGAFFLIVWGWSTGRLGPGALVTAGVLFGLALVWRGLRLARALPPIGHALAGVGCGIVYLSVYLGHLTLHVLGAGVALALLATVSVATVALGLRVRARVIAVLGVLGAFLPLVLPPLLSLRGFGVDRPEAIAWMAMTDLVVVILAARSGFGSLTLTALLLTTLAWIGLFSEPIWTWPEQGALTALMLFIGLAPVPRLARHSGRLPLPEQAVLTLSPLLYGAASWPFVTYADRTLVAVMLGGVAAAYAAAAWWADALNEEGDVWRPLTAAASLFVALALERVMGAENVSVAWLAEGLALAWLGGGRRGTWLRACGALVSFAGGIAHLPLLLAHSDLQLGELPFVHAHSLRALAGIALVALTAIPLRRESHFGEDMRRLLSRGWAVAAVLMMLLYASAEADHVARAFHASGGRWARPPDLGAPSVARRVEMVQAFLTSLLWTLEAAALMVLGWRRRSSFLRWIGLGLLGLTVLKFVFGDLAVVDVFWRFAGAVLVGASLLLVSYFYQRRMRRERG